MRDSIVMIQTLPAWSLNVTGEKPTPPPDEAISTDVGEVW